MVVVDNSGRVRNVDTNDPVLAVQRANFFSDCKSDEPVRIGGPFVRCGNWTTFRRDIGVVSVVWDGSNPETYGGMQVVVGEDVTRVNTGDVNADAMKAIWLAATGKRGAVMHPNVAEFERAGGF